MVAGIDISPEQIQAARTLAEAEKLKVDFRVAPAEEIPFPDHSFEVITANQCWLYFDKAKTIPEVRRLLVEGGLLVTSHFTWLPRRDRLAAASEALVLEHNPQWGAADYGGEVPAHPRWARGPSTSRPSSSTTSPSASHATHGKADFGRAEASERCSPRTRFSGLTRPTTPFSGASRAKNSLSFTRSVVTCSRSAPEPSQQAHRYRSSRWPLRPPEASLATLITTAPSRCRRVGCRCSAGSP